MSPDYTEWTDEELEAEEARLSGVIQQVDEEIAKLRENMRSVDREANPIRNEIEERKWRRARRDPRTQGIRG
jgi:hypothetical protein